MEEIIVWYDKEGDYLEVNFGKQKRKGHFEEVEDDAFQILDSKTGEVFGFAFLNFSEHFDSVHKIFRLPAEIK